MSKSATISWSWVEVERSPKFMWRAQRRQRKFNEGYYCIYILHHITLSYKYIYIYDDDVICNSMTYYGYNIYVMELFLFDMNMFMLNLYTYIDVFKCCCICSELKLYDKVARHQKQYAVSSQRRLKSTRFPLRGCGIN